MLWRGRILRKTAIARIGGAHLSWTSTYAPIWSRSHSSEQYGVRKDHARYELQETKAAPNPAVPLRHPVLRPLGNSTEDRAKDRRDRKDQKAEQRLGPWLSVDFEVKRQLQSKSANPEDILKRYIATREVTTRIVCMCVEARWEWLISFPPRELPTLCKEIRELGLARIVLEQIWGDARSWTVIAAHLHTIQYHLFVFAIIEGLEDLLYNWFIVELPSGVGKGFERTGWRGNLIRSIGKAHDRLEPKDSFGHDGLLRSLFKAYDTLKEAYQNLVGLQKLGYGPAEVVRHAVWNAYLVLKFPNDSDEGTYQRTDPQLYDRFVQFLDETHYGLQKQVMLAHLQLCHPTARVASLAMALLKDYVSGEDKRKYDQSVMDDFLRFDRSRANQAFHRLVSRTIRVSEEHGDVQGAAWIGAHVPKKMEKDLAMMKATTQTSEFSRPRPGHTSP